MTLQEQSKMEDLENALTANDEYLQKVEREKQQLQERNLELNAQVKALTFEVNNYKKDRVKPNAPPLVVGEGINEPQFYFDTYASHNKETVLIALMNAESLLFRYGIIQKAGMPWVLVSA